MTDLATVIPLDSPPRESLVVPASGTFEKRPRRGPGSYNRNLSPEARRDEQRRTLVQAAAHVFARDGYVRASVASILDASGLSRGTFYRHFHDLHEAFFAVQEDAAHGLFRQVEASFHSTDDPAEKLRACIRAYLEICAEFGDLSRVLHREAMTSDGDSAALRRKNQSRVADLFRSGLELAARRGLIRKVPDELTILAVIGAIEAVAVRYLEEEREHEVLEALEPLVRLGLRAFA